MDNNDLKLSLEDKAQRIYQALNDYYTLFPDRQSAPSVVITQDWEVLLDYRGEPCESDFNDYAVMFMEDYEADEWVYTIDTIKGCIPLIQRELDEAKEFCQKNYGEIPTHQNNIPSDVTYFMAFICLYMKHALEKEKIDDWMLEIDLPLSEIYLVEKEMRSPSCGGLILHYDPMKFVKLDESGERILDTSKVRELAERICRDDFTGEFANDDDDPGGNLFRSSLDGLDGPEITF